MAYKKEGSHRHIVRCAWPARSHAWDRCAAQTGLLFCHLPRFAVGCVHSPAGESSADSGRRRNTQLLARVNLVGVAQHRFVGLEDDRVLVGIAVVGFRNGRQRIAAHYVVVL